ncbi:Cytochrome P450(BM-1) [Mycobacterium talmoniae]|uniref:Cytochrome P450(BM-1) n=1 Tax=Mycobacterium talmoniae TaxID=1858794 RepID=A0A2S8BMV6_9MYCO|nr:Cytochrome P450(BM-1) [Mycobacterium talmoniae]
MEQFDHHSEEFAEQWRQIYAGMRHTCPVAHSDRHGGFFILTRYDDAKRVLRDHDTFVCGRDLTFGDNVVRGGVTVPTNPVRMGMMEMDPPQSQNYRQVLAPWLSRKAIDRYRPRMHEIVSWTVDRVIEAGNLDFVDDIANPLPAMISLDYFGLSLEKWNDYATILHKAVYREKGSALQLAGLLDDVRDTVRERRSAAGTRGDLTDALLTAEVDGAPIDDELVTELLFMLLNGGIDTSTALIASMFLYLDEHPDERTALAADATLIPAAVDEMLRYFTPGPASPAQSRGRWTSAAVTSSRETGYGWRWVRPTTIPTSSPTRSGSNSTAPTTASTCPSGSGCTAASGRFSRRWRWRYCWKKCCAGCRTIASTAARCATTPPSHWSTATSQCPRPSHPDHGC